MYKKNFQRIDGILAAEVVAAPGNFLGQDGPLQRQDCETVSDDATYQQGQKHIRVVRQLKGKNNTRERSAHRAAKNGTHADQWPETRAFVGKKHGFEAAERPTHHQQRR